MQLQNISTTKRFKEQLHASIGTPAEAQVAADSDVTS